MPEFLTLKSPDEARALFATFDALSEEPLPLEACDGRVASRPVRSPEELPPWPRAVMDGYAVRSSDTFGASETVPAFLRVRGTVPMGEAWSGPRVGPGEALAVSTGAVVPEPCDAVVMVEYTQKGEGDELEVLRPAAPGQHLMRAGDDIHRDEVVVEAGHRLRPVDLGALAALGVRTLMVHRCPRVAILSTGNEVVAATETPRVGQVRDANSLILGARARQAGCEVSFGGIVGDDFEALEARCSALLAGADVLVLSGGSSAGARDHTAAVLAKLGAEILIHGISVRPGKPTILARLGPKPLLGMPGVPTSATVIFDAFVLPLLWRLGGEVGREVWPMRRRARLTRRVPSVAGREDYIRVKLTGALAEPILGTSAALSSLVRANGLIVVPAGVEGIAEGAEVEVCLSF